ncbi:magnesium chelatase [Candidatus Omnitrophus magneticus]|uniref:Magnesium chelatase n=1 Tax=Candidatus Omnitrophus magneticus TaxID=1609969 RepID=A0A0F0CJ30_9BACT|nr:magnesium chelatase [Candidatus Omnitrophus magneticus]
MLAKVHSGCVIGIDAYPIDVEVDITNGLPSFNVIGLPDVSIRESRGRIKPAIKNSGLFFPAQKITVNLSPADIKKEGAGFDLPIAIGILTALGVIRQEDIDGILFCGELSLTGKLKAVRGALPVAISLSHKYHTFIVPEENSIETANVKNVTVYGAECLRDVVDHLKNIKKFIPVEDSKTYPPSAADNTIDFKDVKGQERIKRALEVAASGSHNVLLIGPPGSGKSMLVKRFPTILPRMTDNESLEATKIYSISGELKNGYILRERPFRSPHHTISYAAMAGGGSSPMPGEISLAHNGVLFLDEFPEFRRDVLETLRQPLESGEIIISRAERAVRYPSKFILIAAMNPCPCGYFTDKKKACQCSSNQIHKYLSKISGPLLDRIDIHIEVPRLNYETLSQKKTGETSIEIKNRVEKTIAIQQKRVDEKIARANYNGYLTSQDIEIFCVLSNESKNLLKSAIVELGMSARAYDKIMKISRTIADMDNSEIIEAHHLGEAISYRCLDKNIWP